jgi:hypothetical protein
VTPGRRRAAAPPRAAGTAAPPHPGRARSSTLGAQFEPDASADATRAATERGQASVLLVAGLLGLVVGALILGAVARGIGVRSNAQRAADIASLAGARAMLDAYPRLFEPPTIDGVPNPTFLAKDAYLQLGRDAALDAAARNVDDGTTTVEFPSADDLAPTRIRVEIRREVTVTTRSANFGTEVEAAAEAELVPATLTLGPGAAGGEYAGPFAVRQGYKMRPDVAPAFDRLEAAAAADGIQLMISSAWRSDAEQAILFAQHPDPKWVAPPGTSLHRLGTELDIGPISAYPWLAAHAPEFGFKLRYPWEPWHWGYVYNAHSSGTSQTADGEIASAVPSFVPAQYRSMLTSAASRYNVSAVLLSAQIYAESKFNPNAVSGAGAQGIAQFMPGTAQGMGLTNPFDPAQAIDAQARLMRDLLRQFASVPLALAAYNAGPAPVAACMCVPPYPETTAYVAQILGLMNGAGDASGGGLSVRLVK